jgi:hypothetical protein
MPYREARINELKVERRSDPSLLNDRISIIKKMRDLKSAITAKYAKGASAKTFLTLLESFLSYETA